MQMQEPQLPGILVVVGSKGMSFFCNSLLGKANVGHIDHHAVVIASYCHSSLSGQDGDNGDRHGRGCETMTGNAGNCGDRQQQWQTVVAGCG